jgi:hypothetical protein
MKDRAGFQHQNRLGGGWGEVDFNSQCQICRRSEKDVILPFGTGAGKSSSGASEAEILDCVQKHPAAKAYKVLTYNCYHWVNEATKGCGLNCGSEFKF